MRSRTSGNVGGLVTAALVLAALAACTSGAPGPDDPGGTGGTGGAGSAGRAAAPAGPVSEEMPPLPADPHAAMVEVRRLLAEQIAPLLTDSGQRWTDVRFLLTTSDTDETAYQGFLFVTVSGTAGDPADGADPPDRLGRAARARGWDDGGLSHLLNVVRGPYHLRSTVRPDNEYRYEVSTPPLNPRTRIEGTGDLRDETDRTEGVPELAAYRERG